MSPKLSPRLGGALLTMAVAVGSGAISSADARTLAMIRESGAIRLCAHPNSLPYASRTAEPPGFQVEVGQALAKQLGVSLTMGWILISYDLPRTDCDIILDTISDPGAPPDFGISLSKPYYRSGVALAVPPGSAISSFAALNGHTKVGVQTGSLAAMTLDQRGVRISVFGFDDDMLAALAAHEIDAAAVSPISAGYYNHTHPEQHVTILPPEEAERELTWNVAVGLRRPDDALREAVDAAIGHLSNDGTIAGIYANYGVVVQNPK
jgi:polar amino acid transport system substrate-binding protein